MITGKVLGNTYVINGLSADVKDFVPDMSAQIYYEVVRVRDQKIYFLEDHLLRLEKSLDGSAYTYPGDEMILDSLKMVLTNNSISEGNLRICLQCGKDPSPALLCYFVPHLYPETHMYLEGVDLLSYPHERMNPGIKKWDDAFRKAVWQFIRERKVYEVLLRNRDGLITEGSRSNVFFLDRHDRLLTPPVKEVLPGITRHHVIKIAQKLGLEIKEECIAQDQLSNFSSCFITGTSPKVLPVRKLDHHIFSPDHPVMHHLMKEYDSLMQQNLRTIS
jgi:branched-chain amino acid aminotransferase